MGGGGGWARLNRGGSLDHKRGAVILAKKREGRWRGGVRVPEAPKGEKDQGPSNTHQKGGRSRT